jgi:hypothetical protein
MARPAHVALAALSAAVVAVAVWLFAQTRARSATPERVVVAPIADAAVARNVPSAQIAAAPRADAGAVALDDASDAHAERVALTEHMSARPGHEHWERKGVAVLDEVGARAQRVEDRGCYVSGCTATYWFSSRDAYDAVVRDEAASPVYAAWKGGKHWTTPEEQSDGEVIVALLLDRPD